MFTGCAILTITTINTCPLMVATGDELSLSDDMEVGLQDVK